MLKDNSKASPSKVQYIDPMKDILPKHIAQVRSK